MEENLGTMCNKDRNSVLQSQKMFGRVMMMNSDKYERFNSIKLLECKCKLCGSSEQF